VIGEPAAPAVGSLVATPEGWRFEGVLTMETAASVLAAADALPFPDSGILDLAGLTHADSAALAVVMALRRRAVAEGRPLHVQNLPPALQSLAVVYGVDDLARGTA
jgi:phospholipid transport system transporter-binding protein